MLRRSLFTAFAALLLGCAPVSATPPQGDAPLRITLTRTVCYGFCPAYSVRIEGDGEVVYEGRAFVNVVGEQRARISPAAVTALVAHFDAADFDNLRDAYRAQVTDLPTYTLTLERNGRIKSVVDYGGPGAGMPDVVRALQSEVDRVADTARWVLRDGEPVRTRPQP